ncbi:MAG: hypothetical protein JST88_01735 [Bacteroidetes bacterium]|nr:hypothetical protein [Bacteroidota bacterium]
MTIRQKAVVHFAKQWYGSLELGVYGYCNTESGELKYFETDCLEVF